MNNIFHKLATTIAFAVGTPWGFTCALLTIILWAVSGPLFDFSNTWQLVINTCTTIVTFLMVFLIQNTQNRDAQATQLKLDELLRASKGARDSLVDVEELSDEELEKFHEEFRKLHEHYEKELLKRKTKKRT